MSQSTTSLSRSGLMPVPIDPSVHHNDSFFHITRQAKQLQQDLQTLLDAQSEGLLNGLGSVEDTSSNGSLTPTPSLPSPRAPLRTVPVRQPPPKKITLRGARRGISRSMADFYRLKDEESHLLGLQLLKREEALKSIDQFSAKREGLESEISSISSQEETKRAQQLKSEAHDLEQEIYELETKLLEMRARHRHLVAEAAQIENSVQSKLSSYKASLSLLDSQVKSFLKRPPVDQPINATEKTKEDSFYTLNPARRTLEMAKEHWTKEKEELKQRREAVELERDALGDGGAIWEDVVKEITQFEKSLRRRMETEMIASRALSASGGAHESDGSGMKDLLSQMDHTTRFLEEKLSLAEDRDWKLLMCSIGAELEAFKEGRVMLLDALGISLPSGEGDKQRVKTDEADRSTPAPILEGLNHEGGGDGGGSQPLSEHDSQILDDVGSRSEDDEPPADFLISHG